MGHLSRFIVSLLIFVGLIVGFIGGGLYFLDSNEFFHIQKIHIGIASDSRKSEDESGENKFSNSISESGSDKSDFKDSPYIDQQTKKLISLLEKFKNSSLLSLDLDLVMVQLKSQEWIKSFSLHRQFPSSLVIELEPFKIPTVYLDSAGKLHPVTETGEILGVMLPQFVPDVIVLKGENFERKIELRKKALAVVKEIPTEGRFSRKTISELTYQPKSGFWTGLMNSKTKVKLGEDNIAIKAARVAQVQEYLEKNPSKGPIGERVIDADLSKKVLVRMRKGP